MLVKDYVIALVESGKATRFGPLWLGRRFLAKNAEALLARKLQASVACPSTGSLRQVTDLSNGVSDSVGPWLVSV